jgi:hypothetical protein
MSHSSSFSVLSHHFTDYLIIDNDITDKHMKLHTRSDRLSRSKQFIIVGHYNYMKIL